MRWRTRWRATIAGSCCSRRASRSPATSTIAARSASIAGSTRPNAEIILSAEPVSLRDGVLTWRNVFTGRTQDIDDVALFVWSTPRIADDAIAKQLHDAGIDVG